MNDDAYFCTLRGEPTFVVRRFMNLVFQEPVDDDISTEFEHVPIFLESVVLFLAESRIGTPSSLRGQLDQVVRTSHLMNDVMIVFCADGSRAREILTRMSESDIVGHAGSIAENYLRLDLEESLKSIGTAMLQMLVRSRKDDFCLAWAMKKSTGA